MKFRNIKSLALVGAVAALLPVGSAMAAGPGFDGIAVVDDGSGGFAVQGCPAAAAGNCQILMTGDGFLQQEVTIDGTVFIQTVIIDSPTAVTADITNLAFSDNTFIQMGSGNGIEGRQTLNEAGPDGTGNLFTASTELNLGWAAKDGVPGLTISQAFWDNNNTGKVESTDASGVTVPDATETSDDFFNSFTLGINLDATGATTGKLMDMVQDVGMSDPSGTGTDFQRFIIAQRSGDLLATDNVAGTTLTAVSSGDGTGGTLGWGATDDVMVTWLGQRVALDGVGLGQSVFGFQSITVDNDDGIISPVTISTYSRSSSDVTQSPFSWGSEVGDPMFDNFGTAPTLP